MWLVAAASAQVVNGDFETGDLSGWSEHSWASISLGSPPVDVRYLYVTSTGDVRGTHVASLSEYDVGF
jgi:hypothetical protein